MRLKKLDFSDAAPDAAPEAAPSQSPARRSWAKTILFSSLLLAFGTLFLNVYLEKNIEAYGDRDHLTNPAGSDQVAALRFAGLDPSSINPEATSFFGTDWLQGIAMLSGLAALLASAWLCAVAASSRERADEFLHHPHL